jgi:hypothetical protein
MQKKMSNDSEKYYAMAVDWGKQYLQDNTEPKELRIKVGQLITNDLQFVDVNIERIVHGGGREQQSAYARLREFKIFIENCKPIVDKII